ncbi:MAG TPA: aminotransferase class I/II-fold pyridoxal phosphate-dependent enzyme [Kineosporiaceae bacterium]|nr:aminotransferase class I/II-fold pyridoxal phosphate-dependent enzyme [Kineosporiaceae bacterium]
MDPFDSTDADLRAAWSIKWTIAPEGVLPVWVAEMDARPCPPVLDAVRTAVERGTFGYPPLDGMHDVREAFAGFAAARFGWPVDPGLVVSTGDVMAGVRFVLETLCEPGPVVVPVPSYPPLLHVVPLAGRALVTVPAVDGGRRMDVGAIDAALAAGARTVLLTNPHNPLGRAWTRPELEALRDVVLRHGARVVSDEIHAPLVLPGATHLPYAAVEGTAEHVTTVTAASKAFNIPGLKCAQIVAGTSGDADRLRAVHYVANHGVSPLGLIATRAAYTEGGPWLDVVVAALADRRDQLAALLAERLPAVRWTPPEATYLAWLDLSRLELADPVARALEAGVLVSNGPDYGPPGGGLERSTRLAFSTSAERLERIVDGLARAWGTAG